MKPGVGLSDGSEAVDESPEGFTERECRVDDLDALLLIEAEAGKAAWTRADMQRFMKQKGTRFRVITTVSAPETPIGFYVVQGHGGAAYLANIAVASGWRRRAVGTFALESIAEWSRRRGLSRITLHVQEENLVAQLFYKAHGFLVVDIVHGHYGGQERVRDAQGPVGLYGRKKRARHGFFGGWSARNCSKRAARSSGVSSSASLQAVS